MMMDQGFQIVLVSVYHDGSGSRATGGGGVSLASLSRPPPPRLHSPSGAGSCPLSVGHDLPPTSRTVTGWVNIQAVVQRGDFRTI